ncbi:hypothetical protein BABA_15172 [Neobacillus bataviensis LMG 21833]|uniref:SGNH/GDSL hydrolase family protein n=2 Tax=Neobacillus bataviensis TaxID=220685 RepID=K6D1U2_9BACI|nr:hypothetical protein BABA_15172 [Neobacillus bataviensis LMG 21833]
MQKILTALLAVVFIIVLYLGQSHWNQQLEASAKGKSPAHSPATADVEKMDDTSDQDLLGLTKNWPETASARFQETLNEKQPFKVLFVGSPAIKDTYPIIQEKLMGAFGEKHIQVDLKTFTTTTTQLINSKQDAEIAAAKADLIVLEPFILTNNGVVGMDKTLNDITKIIIQSKVANPETTFILQPSYPLYKAKTYPKQTDELKTYAAKSNIAYLDHWIAWPDPNSEEIKDYLAPDNDAPSEKGIKVWSDYVVDFLISK